MKMALKLQVAWRRPCHTKLLIFAYFLLLSLLLIPSSIHGDVLMDRRRYSSVAYNFRFSDPLMPLEWPLKRGMWLALKRGMWLAVRPYYYDGVGIHDDIKPNTTDIMEEEMEQADDLYGYWGDVISVESFEAEFNNADYRFDQLGDAIVAYPLPLLLQHTRRLDEYYFGCQKHPSGIHLFGSPRCTPSSQFH
jgi:hypothetical protein